MLKIRSLRSGLCHYRDMRVEPRPGSGCVIDYTDQCASDLDARRIILDLAVMPVLAQEA